MKTTETCSCGARIELEDDDPERVLAAQQEWVSRHVCPEFGPLRRDPTSTTGGKQDIGLGFAPRQFTRYRAH